MKHKMHKKYIYKLKNRLKQICINFGICISKRIDEKQLRDLILLFKKSYIKIDLIRVGDATDGGYLVPEMVSEIDILFSPGVSYVYSFEKNLHETYGIKSFMIDASVDGPADEKYHFEKLYLADHTSGINITLKDWLEKHGHLNNRKRKMLQMDIEGSEYEVLISADASILRHFDIMIIEFHYAAEFMASYSFKSLEYVFKKILEEFWIVHIHPNNNDEIIEVGDVSFPQLLEFTFLRKDLCISTENAIFENLPHRLDFPNNEARSEIRLSDLWSKLY